MELTAQYGLGDTIYSVIVNRASRTVECESCRGEGFFKFTPEGTTKELKAACGERECSRGKKTIWDDYQVDIRALTVGQVELQYRRDFREEKYMCEETGVGSGTIYSNTKRIIQPEIKTNHHNRQDKHIYRGTATSIFPSKEEAEKWGDRIRGTFLIIEKDLRYDLLTQGNSEEES